MASKKANVRRQVIEKMGALAAAGFGLIAALAWNDAIKKAFEALFGQQSTIYAMFTYAIVVTAIAVMVTLWIGRLAGKED